MQWPPARCLDRTPGELATRLRTRAELRRKVCSVSCVPRRHLEFGDVAFVAANDLHVVNSGDGPGDLRGGGSLGSRRRRWRRDAVDRGVAYGGSCFLLDV